MGQILTYTIAGCGCCGGSGSGSGSGGCPCAFDLTVGGDSSCTPAGTYTLVAASLAGGADCLYSSESAPLWQLQKVGGVWTLTDTTNGVTYAGDNWNGCDDVAVFYLLSHTCGSGSGSGSGAPPNFVYITPNTEYGTDCADCPDGSGSGLALDCEGCLFESPGVGKQLYLTILGCGCLNGTYSLTYHGAGDPVYNFEWMITRVIDPDDPLAPADDSPCPDLWWHAGYNCSNPGGEPTYPSNGLVIVLRGLVCAFNMVLVSCDPVVMVSPYFPTVGFQGCLNGPYFPEYQDGIGCLEPTLIITE